MERARFVIYRLDTGTITAVGECRSDDVEVQAGDGEATLRIAMDADIDDTTHRVEGGAIVAI